MRLALIADTFPPLRTSGAVQLRDLSREFVKRGHEVTVILPDSTLEERWSLGQRDGANVLRLKTPSARDGGYVRRALGELVMPFAMLRNLRVSPVAEVRWDGVVWYSPSIFHGPLVRAIKRASGCRAYLVVRDLFPQWAVDTGLMRRGLAYWFFDAVARYQYSVADVIGVQTEGNLAFFRHWEAGEGNELQVLRNWLGEPASRRCLIRIEETSLAGRRIFVYAGNMGVAQGMDRLLELADRLKHRRDIGFLFVGRGKETMRLQRIASARHLDNVLFFDEIHPDEIPDLYRQCSVGLVALDPRHTSHNIPGKFLSYMQGGLPVLAVVNPGNDLADIIRRENVGFVSEHDDPARLQDLAQELVDKLEADESLPARCSALFYRRFSAEHAVRQIALALSEGRGEL